MRFRSVRSRLGLPSNALSIGRKAIAAGDRHDIARPIDFDQRHFLLVEPGQDVEGDAAAAVQHDDPRRQVGIAFEVAVGFLLLRIVGEAVADEECAGFDPERDAVAGEDQRITSSAVALPSCPSNAYRVGPNAETGPPIRNRQEV